MSSVLWLRDWRESRGGVRVQFARARGSTWSLHLATWQSCLTSPFSTGGVGGGKEGGMEGGAGEALALRSLESTMGGHGGTALGQVAG